MPTYIYDRYDLVSFEKVLAKVPVNDSLYEPVYNEINSRTEWKITHVKERGDVHTCLITNHDEKLLRSRIAMKCKVKIPTAHGGARTVPYAPSKQIWQLLRDGYAATRSYNPFLEYVRSLDQRKNLQEQSPENFLKILEAEDGEYNRWVQWLMFATVFLRCLHPGLLLRHVPVLIGVPNIGKSAILRNMLPKEMQEAYFNDNFTFSMFPQQQMEAVRGRLIIELAEMSGSRKSEVGRMRNFLTTVKDTYRPPWGENIQDFPRRCLLVGTANPNDQFLPNDEAMRDRILPVFLNSTGGADVEKHMECYRDSYWLWIYKALGQTSHYAGEKLLRRPNSLKETHLALTSTVTSDDELEMSNAIEAYSKSSHAFSTIEFLNEYQVLGNTDKEIDQQWTLKNREVVQAFRKAMNQHGYIQKSNKGKKVWRPLRS